MPPYRVVLLFPRVYPDIGGVYPRVKSAMDLQPTEMVLSSGTGTPLFLCLMLKQFQTMETKVKMELVPTTAGEAVASIDAAKISDVTKNLIKCRALVSDLWGYVVTSYIQVFPEADKIDDNTLDKFKDLCNQLGCEIVTLTADVMEGNFTASNFENI